LREKENPFSKFKELTQEDWERFDTKCELVDFVVNSEYIWWLQSQNELDHQLGNTRYAKK
jgi:hypothetical protein